MEPNKDELLNSIRKGTVCDNELLKKIYGYDLSFEGFAEKALKKLEETKYIKWEDGQLIMI